MYKECDEVTVGLMAMRWVVTFINLSVGAWFLIVLIGSLRSEESMHVRSTVTEKDLKMERRLRYLTIVAVFGSILSCVFYNFGPIIFCFYNGSESDSLTDLMFYLGSLALFGCCLVYLALYCVFCIRFLYSLENTTYAPNSCAKYWFLTCIVVSATLAVFAIVILLVFEDNTAYSVVIALLGGCVVLYVCNCVALLYSFVQKLSQMISTFVNNFGRVSNVTLNKLNKTVSIDFADDVEDQKEPDPKNASQSGQDTKDTESAENIRKLSLMIRDMSKYSILMCVAMVSSFVMVIVAGISGVYPDNVNMTTLALNFVILDGLVNVTCLYMQFFFNRKYYNRCCGKCHSWCESRYTHEINADLVRSASTDDNYYLQIKKMDKEGNVGIERKDVGIAGNDDNGPEAGISGDDNAFVSDKPAQSDPGVGQVQTGASVHAVADITLFSQRSLE